LLHWINDRETPVVFKLTPGRSFVELHQRSGAMCPLHDEVAAEFLVQKKKHNLHVDAAAGSPVPFY